MSEEAAAQYRKTMKPAIGLVLIIGGFFVAWMPFFIEHLIKALKGKLEEIPEWLEISIYILAVSSSIWNPIIYVKTNSNFREASFKILTRLCSCCLKSSVSPSHESQRQPAPLPGSAATIA